MVWEFHASYLAQLDQQGQLVGSPTPTLILVRGKKILITPAALFSFCYPNVPVLEVDPTYLNHQCTKRYSWIVDDIAVGSQIFAQARGKIHRQDLLPKAIVWFHYVRMI